MRHMRKHALDGLENVRAPSNRLPWITMCLYKVNCTSIYDVVRGRKKQNL